MSTPINPIVAQETKNFSNLLLCPILFTPLKDAVILTPCNHTISEEALRRLYQTALSHQIEGIQQPPCPLCRRTITGHAPNLLIRSLVESALRIHLEASLPTISASLASDEEIDPATIPFPGPPAKFVLKSGEWDFENEEDRTVRTLSFTSRTDSLFDELSIHGYRNGEVSLRIYFQNHKKIALDYLKNCGIKICPEHEICNFYSSNLSDTKLLFKIVMLHNEIPSDKIPLIRDLVMRGHWKSPSHPPKRPRLFFDTH